MVFEYAFFKMKMLNKNLNKPTLERNMVFFEYITQNQKLERKIQTNET